MWDIWHLHLGVTCFLYWLSLFKSFHSIVSNPIKCHCRKLRLESLIQRKPFTISDMVYYSYDKLVIQNNTYVIAALRLLSIIYWWESLINYSHSKLEILFLFKGIIKAPKMQRDLFWFCVQANRKLLFLKI